MRIVFPMVLVLVVLACGCAGRKPAAETTPGATPVFAPVPGATTEGGLIVTPENALIGTVARVNLNGRFVVLTFPVARLPQVEQRLSVYRGGLKVGEVKVTGFRLDDNVVADIVAGEAQADDQVRDR